MSSPESSYDAVADWYESYTTSGKGRFIAQEVRAMMVRLLGRGSGRCLDVGCGDGRHTAAMQSLGWDVDGVDSSDAQVRKAVARGVRAVVSDARALPYGEASFQAATALMISTDVEDFTAAVLEIARVLAPGGRLVFVGPHPCFAGCFVQRHEDGSVLVLPRYQERVRLPAGEFSSGVRSRVGAVNLPLSDLLGAICGAGLLIESVIESAGDSGLVVPHLLGLQARKARSPVGLG